MISGRNGMAGRLLLLLLYLRYFCSESFVLIIPLRNPHSLTRDIDVLTVNYQFVNFKLIIIFNAFFFSYA